MEREDCKALCLSIFSDISRELFQNRFDTKLSYSDQVLFERFLDYVENTYGFSKVGTVFFANWIESSFNYWVTQRKTYERIFFNWIFGKKAIARYEKIKHKDFLLNHSKFRTLRSKYGISSMRNIRNKENDEFYKDMYKSLNPVEESYKNLCQVEDEKLAYCIQFTSLYNQASEHCLFCKFKENCKKVLLLNYPKLYKLRAL